MPISVQNPMSHRSEEEYMHSTVKSSNYPLTPIEGINPLDVDENDLSSSDLESIAILYDKIRQLFRNKNELIALSHEEREHHDMELARDFDLHLTDVMGQLNSSLTSVGFDEGSIGYDTMRQMLILRLKQSLLDLCSRRTIDYFNLVAHRNQSEYVSAIFNALGSLLQNQN